MGASCLSGLALTSELGFLKLPSVNPQAITTQTPGPLCCKGWLQAFVTRPEGWDGEGNGSPLQYSCLENSMDRGAWWAPVHGVAKSWTRPSDCHSLSPSGVAPEASGDSASGDQPRIPPPAGPWAWERPCSILGPPAQAPLALPPPSGSWRVGEPSVSQGGMTCSQRADASPGDQAGMADLWSCSKAGGGLGGPGLGLLVVLER